ncbi:MAG: HNH endonuclease [Chloroflexota bacterium]
MKGTNWQRDELILAFNLYCKTPFGRIHNRNPDIIALANIIGRSPSAVSWKLANFARLDPSLKQRGIAGATHGSKSEVEIWHAFNDSWEQLAFESECLLARAKGQSVEQAVDNKGEELPKEGRERERFVRLRINQKFFRSTVLATYDSRCCVTGLPVVELLVASHIVPWSHDAKNRLNPRNGLCLNAIHDRAFDRGLLTITPEYHVKLSSSLQGFVEDTSVIDLLAQYDGQKMRLPQRFVPDQDFITYHNDVIFQS